MEYQPVSLGMDWSLFANLLKVSMNTGYPHPVQNLAPKPDVLSKNRHLK